MIEKKRARTKSGHFLADDPSTPENEAWVEKTPVAKKTRKTATVLPPVGSAARKAMVLRGEIKE
jgi:hypothetical protein